MTTDQLLNSMGKRTFVNCFEARKNKGSKLNKGDVIRADSPDSKKFTENSLSSRTSRLNRIFRENRECEALKICYNSGRLSRNTVAKAVQLYRKYC